jgi:beta-glucosidase
MTSKVETVLQSLTLEEKIALLAGKDFWETVPIPEKGVPAIKVWLPLIAMDMLRI